ncbi:hypothetical protein [Sphingobium bisphenolivorans]|uniref:hypothetical protein n=1 Tax=Sphingobium bisphenolivorans TaxID=1335760 RepID=UPI0012699903|nr:hypothetical protein [Sphingobium bisphenolivorans]
MENISHQLAAYLRSWYETTVKSKTAAGVTVNLTFDEFLALFEKRQLNSLQKAIDANSIRYLQDEHNPYAYVATWKSYAACSSGVYDVNTALICSRMKSAKINLPAAGDKLRPSHCANIRRSLTGVEKTEEHCQAISEAKKGKPIAGWSEERKTARRELRQAQEAAKRAACAPLELIVEQPEKSIEVATKIELADYEETVEGMVDRLNEADIYFDLSAASVVRTHLARNYGEWFARQGTYWDDYFACGWQQSGIVLEVCCFAISSHIECTWSFPAEDKALAMLFKLTFGGV